MVTKVKKGIAHSTVLNANEYVVEVDATTEAAFVEADNFFQYENAQIRSIQSQKVVDKVGKILEKLSLEGNLNKEEKIQ